MLTDWIHWLSSKTLADLLLLLAPLLCLDAPRYCFANVAMCLHDAVRDVCARLGADDAPNPTRYCPSVCVVLAGLNEAETIVSTLRSVWGSYPKLEVIVVDDGSSDGMASLARAFAQTHAGVVVLRKPHRGGKSSALNCAIPFTKADIIICVDTDSELDEGAIWRVVQPFADPAVGAVGGAIVARNGDQCLVAQLQAAEYLRSIFVARMLASRLGMLNIVSGAFGAFRREAVQRAKGWDVGPGEDGDLVFRLRKAGWRIVHEPYAQCLTNVPTTWKGLFKQRRRWDWAIVTFDCRKHVDMANPLSSNFQWSDFSMLVESWFFRIGLTVAFFVYLIWLALAPNVDMAYVLLTNYIAYLALDVLNWAVVLYYSANRRRDAACIGSFLLAPAFFFFLKLATLVAIVEETFWRRSFDDEYVPEHVRRVTWRW